jgi:hypothetical protein
METPRFEVRLASARAIGVQEAAQLWLDRGLPWAHKTLGAHRALGRGPWWDLHLELTNLPPHLNPSDLPTDHPRFLLEVLADADPAAPLGGDDGGRLDDALACQAPWVYEAHHEALPMPAGWLQGKQGRLSLRLAVPQRLVPTLAAPNAWTSAAAPAPSEVWAHDANLKRPPRAELRPLYPTRVHHVGVIREWPKRDGVSQDGKQGLLSWSMPAFLTDPDGDLWLQHQGVIRLNHTGGWERFSEPHVLKGKRAKGCHVRGGGFGPDGRLWVLTQDGLAEHLGGGTWAMTTKNDGLPSHDLGGIAWRDGQPVLATGAGLAFRQPDGSWKVLAQPLAGKGCRELVAGPDGVLWVLGPQGVARVAPDDSVTTFKKKQGYNDHHGLLALPDGGLLLAELRGISRLAPGASKIEPLAWLREAVPGPTRALALDPDGQTVWAIQGYSRLLRLTPGEPIRVYAFQDTLFTYPNPQLPQGSYAEYLTRVAATREGLWVGNTSLLWISRDALREADAAPALYVPPSGAVLVPPWPA